MTKLTHEAQGTFAISPTPFHDDGRVDQYPEVDGADRQQICRGVLQIEADEREQQRQRNGCGDDKTRPDVVEEEDQHNDHEQHAAEQIALDCFGGQIDEITAVVER